MSAETSRIILSMQFAAVGLYDSADAIQTKAIMALADFPKRFAPPILRSASRNEPLVHRG